MNEISFVDELKLIPQFSEISDEELTNMKNKFKNILKKINLEIIDDFKIGFKIVPNIINNEPEGYICNLVDKGHYPLFDMDISRDGELILIRQIKPYDIDKIKKMCELQKFPLEINGYKLFYENNNILLEKNNESKIVTVKNLFNDENSDYDPLIVNSETEFNNCNYMILQQFSQENKIALLLNRYAWGMNIACAYLDLETAEIYLWGSANYDYPEGLSVRKTEQDVEIFLNANGKDRVVVYKNSNLKMLPTIDNIYSRSGWSDFNCKMEFEGLYKYSVFFKEIDINLTQYVDEIFSKASEYIRSNKREKAIEFFQKIVDCPSSEFRYFRQNAIKDVSIYNIACCQSVLGDLDNAMQNLLKIEDEWVDWSYLQDDEDFLNLKDRDEFKELLSRHS